MLQSLHCSVYVSYDTGLISHYLEGWGLHGKDRCCYIR